MPHACGRNRRSARQIAGIPGSAACRTVRNRCDGARPSRSYYTEFVEKTPEDTIVLTMACGKFRFYDKDLGKLGDFPRFMDCGQCNDAYTAVVTAQALAGALECDINNLPLSLIFSWYEQKAVAILLTLHALGYAISSWDLPCRLFSRPISSTSLWTNGISS